MWVKWPCMCPIYMLQVTYKLWYRPIALTGSCGNLPTRSYSSSMISCLCPPSLSREHRRTAPPDNIRNAPSVAPTESEKHMWHPALGNYSMPITHMLPSTQRLFDEGLMLAFNFNQHEAQIWFNLSVATESDCAMCWWGLAYSHSPYLNQPYSIHPDDPILGLAAARHAANIAAKETKLTPKERGLIAAMATRYPSTPSQEPSAWAAPAARYVSALEALYSSLPGDDVDVATFLAEALMLTMCRQDGYHFYDEHTGQPHAYTARAEELLVSAIAQSKASASPHPYAPHLYIHLTEPSSPSNASSSLQTVRSQTSHEAGAARGLPSASLLAQSLAGTDNQHLLHMPAHTYLRVGRYADAWRQNQQVAHAADAHYLEHAQRPYAPAHDVAFGLYGACMAGMRKAALASSATLRGIYLSFPDRSDGPGPEMGWSLQYTTLLRFGDFEGVLDLSQWMPRAWPYAHVLRQYAAGSALVQLGRHAEATEAYAQLVHAAAAASPTFAPLVKVARLALLANLQANGSPFNGSLTSAIATLADAVDEQAGWAYDEPPKFHMPLRQCLGRLLLRAHQAERAQAVFSADLTQFPANGYSLWGVHQSMLLQPQRYSKSEVARMEEQMHVAWREADGPLTTSCAAFDPPIQPPNSRKL